MKRTLSLLLVLVMVIAMIPNVFAETDSSEVEFDKLTQGQEADNPTPAEIDVSYTTAWDVHYYKITPAKADILKLTVENGTIELQGVTANEDGNYPVAAETAYIVVVTKTDATAATTWNAAHVHTEVEIPAVDATCSTPGATAGVKCSVCDEVLTAPTETPSLGHTAEYTDNGDGTHDGACSVCDEVVVDNEAHADEDSDNVCDACEASLEPVVPTDENLKFYNTGNLMLGDDIRALFIINAKSLTYDEIYVEFNMNGVTTTPQKESNSTATVLRYTYVVPAAYMTTDFTATVYGVKDNVTYRGEVLSFSVRKYIDASMPTWIDAGATTQCALAMALLHYGARTQIQFGINTEKLANAELSPEYLAYLPTEVPSLGTLPTVDETGKQVKISNMGLMLQEKVKLSTIFNSTTDYSDDVTIEVKHHRSSDGEVVTYTYTTADTDYVSLVNTKNIRFFFDKLAPSQLRDEVEFTVYENDVAVSATYIRSVDMIMNNSNYLNNETMSELVYAIMNYSDCAKAVFG